MNKRLAFLEQTTSSGAADSFAFYALALEYRKEQRYEDAERTFRALRDKDPEYLALYLMAGQTLVEAGRGTDARTWLEQGVAIAQKRGDQKTLGELETALAETE